jgi:hypothetical protein
VFLFRFPVISWRLGGTVRSTKSSIAQLPGRATPHGAQFRGMELPSVLLI